MKVAPKFANSPWTFDSAIFQIIKLTITKLEVENRLAEQFQLRL